jgi:thiamine pyrophosphokinase
VAGGRLAKQFTPEIRKSNYIIGVDRGAWWLIANGIVPDVALGDFDSVTGGQFQIINKQSKKILIYPKKKDQTDMELAIDHGINLHPGRVRIYGAVGDRLDHETANIQLAERLHDAGIEGVIIDERNEARVVSRRLTIRKDRRFRYVSVIPISETVNVTLTGFVYDVSRAGIKRGQTLGISNEILLAQGRIDVHSGKALVVRSKQ